MSLYTWLNNNGYRDNNYPLEKYQYRSTYETNLSNPQCGINWRHAYEGPTFVNVNVSETYDVSQIKEYVLSLLDEKTEGLAENITEAAIQKI